MRFQRSEYKRLDRNRNADIREDLNNFSLNETETEYRNKWKTAQENPEQNSQNIDYIQTQKKKLRQSQRTMERSVKENA